uniref:Uncharacterized protein n=1 Tax=Janibacter limosus TaxID=53458 RepID=A0AC61U6W6_9MICO|nr:hypothetical protein [Janibacter limosus]
MTHGADSTRLREIGDQLIAEGRRLREFEQQGSAQIAVLADARVRAGLRRLRTRLGRGAAAAGGGGSSPAALRRTSSGTGRGPGLGERRLGWDLATGAGAQGAATTAGRRGEPPGPAGGHDTAGAGGLPRE